MLSFLLSVGAIYAFIPIIIIIILIIAARGSVGGDFFGLFGVGTLLGFSRGIGSGGSGRGLKRKYTTNTAKTSAASAKVGSTVIGHASGKPTDYTPSNKVAAAIYGSSIPLYNSQKGIKGIDTSKSAWRKMRASIKAEETDLSKSMLGRLSDDELMTMGESIFGLGFATSMASRSRDDVITRLEKTMTLAQVRQYLKTHGLEHAIKGTPTPLQAPTAGGLAAAGSMATAIPEFYKTWYKAKRGKIGKEKQTMGMLTEMSDEELIDLCRKYNVPVSQNMSRDALLNAAYLRMSSAQVNYNYSKIIKNRTGKGNVFRPGQPAAPKSPSSPGSSPSAEGSTPEGIPAGEMKLNILNNLSEEQMMLMLQRYGIAIPETRNRSILQTYIYNKLSVDQIRTFVEEGGK